MGLRLEVDEGFMFGKDLYFLNTFEVAPQLFDAVKNQDKLLIVNVILFSRGLKTQNS